MSREHLGVWETHRFIGLLCLGQLSDGLFGDDEDVSGGLRSNVGQGHALEKKGGVGRAQVLSRLGPSECHFPIFIIIIAEPWRHFRCRQPFQMEKNPLTKGEKNQHVVQQLPDTKQDKYQKRVLLATESCLTGHGVPSLIGFVTLDLRLNTGLSFE